MSLGTEGVGMPHVAANAPSRVGALVRAHAWSVVVWIGMLGWSAAVFALVRSYYADFRLGRYDLGNMVQAVWNTAHGRPLEVTDAAGEQLVRLGGHVDPFLVLLTPLWLVAPTPLTLVGAQVAACALGALPVFWLARRRLESEMAAALLAAAYLSYPWLAWTALDAIHPVAFAIPLLLFAIWFLETDRVWAFVACAILAASTMELMGLPIAGLGLWYWLARGRRRVGLVTAVAGVTWTIVCLKVIVPHYRGEESAFYGLYESIGGSPEGIVRTALTDPGAIAAALAGGPELAFVLALAAPLAGVFLLAPGLAAVALPHLLANTLADASTPVDPRAHYVAPLIPLLLAATVFGLARLQPSHRVRGAATVLLLSAVTSIAFGPWPGSPSSTPRHLGAEASAARVEALRAAVARVPDDAAVSSTNRVGSRLSARRYVYGVPVVGRGRSRAEWIVVDRLDPTPATVRVANFRSQRDLLRRFVAGLDESPEWSRVFDRADVVVFRRAR